MEGVARELGEDLFLLAPGAAAARSRQGFLATLAERQGAVEAHYLEREALATKLELEAESFQLGLLAMIDDLGEVPAQLNTDLQSGALSCVELLVCGEKVPMQPVASADPGVDA